jgi:hypothetical protein
LGDFREMMRSLRPYIELWKESRVGAGAAATAV